MLSSLDVTIIVCYSAVTVGVGLWFARKTRGTTEFFLAGRKLVWPVIGLSLFATNISTEHLVGLAQEPEGQRPPGQGDPYRRGDPPTRDDEEGTQIPSGEDSGTQRQR